ncbi:MAG TPA: sulfatase-like hydrolase/transferase [Verrucomicrobiota bacterium]|nr:sulfatase-like hydrolase/transferase [Verrucomicrobiota bacterium]HRT55123.1 sulfatase-like hydrolase/transferase [Candidatus Paceibacterota bacterium]
MSQLIQIQPTALALSKSSAPKPPARQPSAPLGRSRTTRNIALGAMVALLLAATAGAKPNGPNIILCMADDQGWGDMAYNGHPIVKTPHFDQLSKEAIRFDRFYAAAPVCSPTRGSVLTGRHPNRFGCFSWGFSLRPQEITLAEVLKGAGYMTGHFGKWHLGTVYKGSPVNPGASGFDTWLSAPNFFDNDPILSREGVATPFQGESSMIVVDAALEFIRQQAKAKQAFLAVVWFGSPHLPHQASDQDRALYADQKPALANFYGEITGMDRAFGKLRAEVARLGIRDNTILWYCSDNGGLPKVGSTGGRGNKGLIYEGGLRVPALLEWPARFPKPRVVATPCGTVDIYPTLLAATGAQAEQQPPLDGINILPLIEGGASIRSKPLGFWDYPIRGQQASSAALMEELLQLQAKGKQMEDPARLLLDAGRIKPSYPEDNFPGHAAWLDWPWKLHRVQSPENAVKFELYNLQQDSEEVRDLLEAEPERAKAMKSGLESWLASVARSLNGKDYH